MAHLLIFLLPLAVIGVIVLSYLKVLYDWWRQVKITREKPTKSAEEARTYVVEKYSQAPGPTPYPILGSLALMADYEVPFEAFTALSKKYGEIYSLTLGTTRCVVVNNLDRIREVLNQNGKYFGGRPDFLRFHKLFGGDRNNSLALCDWSNLQQKRRNLARKHCSPRDASSFHQKMSDVGCFEMQEMMEHLGKTNTPDTDFHLKPMIMQAAANMFSQYMCSLRFEYEDKEFQKLVRSFDEIFWEINQGYAVDFLPWLAPFYTRHMAKLVGWSGYIREFIMTRIIDQRERTLEVDQPEKDFTDALLKSLRDDPAVERDTIIYMLEDFLGGHSAIGNLVVLALGYIAKNPSIGTKIQAEVDTVTDCGRRTISLNDMDKMPYTVATIFEVLRYSSSPIVPHVATEDAQIAGYGITKGTVVFINNYDLNTNEKYWDEPKKFDPERFLELTSTTPSLEKSQSSDSLDSGIDFDTKLPKSTNATGEAMPMYRVKKNIPHFLPFSIGKRTCIGQNLVRGFSFIMLGNILQTYNVSSSDPSGIVMYPACVAVPPDTFPVKLERRTVIY